MLTDGSGPLGGGKKGPGAEMDETYFGGVRKMGAGRQAHESRDSYLRNGRVHRRVRTFTTENVQGATIVPIINERNITKASER